jgi:4-amino-4-deoxy-L-arabinose transferase-like glycosyltransferase
VDAGQVSLQTLSRHHQLRSGWGHGRWSLLGIVLLAWALRLPPVFDNRLHADEALYGYWGLLIRWGEDPWLADVPIDKPPLLPYLVAGAQTVFGGHLESGPSTSEFAIRFPGLGAGLLAVVLVTSLTYYLYRERWTATTAALGLALSPFAILFSGTAFTDPTMVALGLAACVAIVRDRPGLAGLMVGLSCATKQTGLVWLPLVVAILAVRRESGADCLSSLLPFIAGLSGPIGLMWVWDRIRVLQGTESFLRLGVASYGGLRTIWPQELGVRLRGWSELARYLFAPRVVCILLLLGMPTLVWRAVQDDRPRGAFFDLLLVCFSVLYTLVHWLWAFPVWDRYLLPLVPVLAILLGRFLGVVITWVGQAVESVNPTIRGWVVTLCSLVLVAFLIGPAINAACSRYPVGGDHWAYDGIDDVATYLRALPEGSVVYQHWLGWHYAYYLFRAPIYVAYWSTPAWLAQDVMAFGDKESRYITFPSWESSDRVAQGLAGVGYQLDPVLTTAHRDSSASFVVYHIRPLSH